MDNRPWRKSSFSKDDNCVEIAFERGTVFLRDTKDRSVAAHSFTSGEWAAFVAGVKAGEFDV